MGSEQIPDLRWNRRRGRHLRQERSNGCIENLRCRLYAGDFGDWRHGQARKLIAAAAAYPIAVLVQEYRFALGNSQFARCPVDFGAYPERYVAGNRTAELNFLKRVDLNQGIMDRYHRIAQHGVLNVVDGVHSAGNHRIGIEPASGPATAEPRRRFRMSRTIRCRVPGASRRER